MSICFTSWRSRGRTPAPLTDDRGGDFAGTGVAKRVGDILGIAFGRGINLAQRDDFGLLGKLGTIGSKLGPKRLPGGDRVLAGHIDKMKQHTAALDMAKEPVAKAGALMRTFDQPGNVGHHEFTFIHADHPRLG